MKEDMAVEDNMKKQVEEESAKVGSRRGDVLC